MKRSFLGIILIIAVHGIALAQEARHEFTVQGSGFYTKETTGSGVTSSPSYSGGFMAGYRFHLSRRISLEADYDYFRNSQKFFAPTGASAVSTNVHGATANVVFNLPEFRKVRTFALAGGGTLFFDPRKGNLESQTQGTFVYGGGADLPLTRHIAIRGEYRGFVYKAPDFKVAEFRTDKYTHSAVPSIGLVFNF